MPNFRRPDNRNLFQFDIHTIEPILSDANSLLTQNANEMIELLLSIDLDQTEITEIKQLTSEARFIVKQLADYRSIDGRTFKNGKDKMSGELDPISEGSIFRCKATVNRHAINTFQGNNMKQTIINRMSDFHKLYDTELEE